MTYYIRVERRVWQDRHKQRAWDEKEAQERSGERRSSSAHASLSLPLSLFLSLCLCTCLCSCLTTWSVWSSSLLTYTMMRVPVSHYFWFWIWMSRGYSLYDHKEPSILDKNSQCRQESSRLSQNRDQRKDHAQSLSGCDDDTGVIFREVKRLFSTTSLFLQLTFRSTFVSDSVGSNVTTCCSLEPLSWISSSNWSTRDI